jgi:hypothetical protein
MHNKRYIFKTHEMYIQRIEYSNISIHYLIKSIRTPTRSCKPTFPVTHFPVVDINTGWAHPSAL